VGADGGEARLVVAPMRLFGRRVEIQDRAVAG